MPIKTIAEIPHNVILRCDPEVGQNKINFLFFEGDDSRHDIGALDITLIYSGKKSCFYEASNIGASHGWGPFLVDIAMEWISSQNGWLLPDRRYLTPDAKKMWKVYVNKEIRPDIKFVPLKDELIEKFKITHVEDELKCIFQKPVRTLIDELIDQNKWEVRTSE